MSAQSISTIGYAAPAKAAPFEVFKFQTSKALGPKDVHIKIKYAGICHSDIHSVRGDWSEDGGIFPMVPGHEIAGIVESCGADVSKFKVGDKVSVGVFVSTCHECKFCKKSLEQHCNKLVLTYNSRYPDGSVTYGGYSRDIVVEEECVLKLPDNLDMCAAAPLACAGITVYSPMKHWKMDRPGFRLAVAGLGGLGHMAVKFGVAFGCHVTVLSSSDKKRQLALEELKANAYVNMSNAEEVKANVGCFDGIIDTVAAPKNMDEYLSLLDYDGVLVTVGLPERAYKAQIAPSTVIMARKTIAGSCIGGIAESQEMFDFCGKHNITAMVEKINVDNIDKAYDRVVNGDVQFRFVIDIDGSCPKLT